MLATLLVAVLVAHALGDYWVQTSWQAITKALPGREGRRACAAHVATYTATLATVVGAVAASQGIHPDPWRALAGLAISAASHYVADRRAPLRRLALAAGKDPVWLDAGGLALLDQAWHYAWLLLATLATV